MGVNGAGKSTLFHALAGTLAGARATVGIRGTSGGGGTAAGRGTALSGGNGGEGTTPGEIVRFAPQEPAFPDWLDVADVARLYGWELADLARRVPGMLLEEIRGHFPFHALSAGQPAGALGRAGPGDRMLPDPGG